MEYDWREDVESVRELFGEFVVADDEALRILNIVRYERGIRYDFHKKMMAVREILRDEGHEVPFKIGGYKRRKSHE